MVAVVLSQIREDGASTETQTKILAYELSGHLVEASSDHMTGYFLQNISLVFQMGHVHFICFKFYSISMFVLNVVYLFEFVLRIYFFIFIAL